MMVVASSSGRRVGGQGRGLSFFNLGSRLVGKVLFLFSRSPHDGVLRAGTTLQGDEQNYARTIIAINPRLIHRWCSVPNLYLSYSGYYCPGPQFPLNIFILVHRLPTRGRQGRRTLICSIWCTAGRKCSSPFKPFSYRCALQTAMSKVETSNTSWKICIRFNKINKVVILPLMYVQAGESAIITRNSTFNGLLFMVIPFVVSKFISSTKGWRNYSIFPGFLDPL